jgi:type IV pilus assembly protein PilX
MRTCPMSSTRRTRPPARQSGVILLIVLVALVALLAAGVALVRSSDVGLLQAGNLAFQRDLQNQAERGIKAALDQFGAKGDLATDSARTANIPGINYSAQRLPTDVRGIPLALLSQARFEDAGMTGEDIVDALNAVTVRTVIDRLCANTGAYNASTCTNFDPTVGEKPANTDSQDPLARKEAELPVYRISVRATGPRNTQVFLQTTLTR